MKRSPYCPANELMDVLKMGGVHERVRRHR